MWCNVGGDEEGVGLPKLQHQNLPYVQNKKNTQLNNAAYNNFIILSIRTGVRHSLGYYTFCCHVNNDGNDDGDDENASM